MSLHLVESKLSLAGTRYVLAIIRLACEADSSHDCIGNNIANWTTSSPPYPPTVNIPLVQVRVLCPYFHLCSPLFAQIFRPLPGVDS
jgi:hypothetical protein